MTPAAPSPAPGHTGGSTSNLTGPKCLSDAIRAEPFPEKFKEPTKVCNYEPNMNPETWLSSYGMAMDMKNASPNLCARYMYLMLAEGAPKIWLDRLPPRSINSWEELKAAFIKNFAGTCKKQYTEADLDRCVMRKTESARQWMGRVTEILQSSLNISAHTAISYMEKNCGFEPLTHKLGRMREDPACNNISIGEVVTTANKYAATDKRPGETEEQQRNNRISGGRNPNPNQSNSNQNGNNKRPYEGGNSEFVGTTQTTGYRGPRPGGNFRGGPPRNKNFNEMYSMPCPKHSKNGRPSNHSLAQCADIRAWMRHEQEGQRSQGNFGGSSGFNGNNGNSMGPGQGAGSNGPPNNNIGSSQQQNQVMTGYQ